MNLYQVAATHLSLRHRGVSFKFYPLTIGNLAEYEFWAISTFPGKRKVALQQADDCLDGLIKLLELSSKKSYRRIKKLLRSDAMLVEIDKKVLPHILGSSYNDEKAEKDDTDWSWIFRGLAELFSFTPSVVKEMTIDQVTAYLVSKTVKFDTLEQATEYIRELKSGKSISNN